MTSNGFTKKNNFDLKSSENSFEDSISYHNHRLPRESIFLSSYSTFLEFNRLDIGDIYSQCFMEIRVKPKSKERLSYHVMEYVGYYLKSLPWRPIFEQYSRVMQKPVQHSDGYTKFELL